MKVEKVGGGGQWNGNVFDRGDTVKLTATAAEGWRFVGWFVDATSPSRQNEESSAFVKRDEDVASTESVWTFAADADISLLAVFERIPVYSVNGEAVREGTVMSFAAPESVVLGGTTQLVCRGTSAYPEKGASFSLTIVGDVAFEATPAAGYSLMRWTISPHPTLSTLLHGQETPAPSTSSTLLHGKSRFGQSREKWRNRMRGNGKCGGMLTFRYEKVALM